MKLRHGFCAASLVFIGGHAAADVVLDWNTVLLEAIRTSSSPPPRASRAMAMVHGAVYDAVNSIDRTHFPYRVDMVAPAGASREAAAATAAHRVLSDLFPAQSATFDAALATSLAGVPDGQGKQDGMAVGMSVGDSMISWRLTDGSNNPSSYMPGNQPGEWRPTLPANAAGLLPQWGGMTPFAMTSGAQFRPVAPPALSSAEYAAAVNEVQEIGALNSATRTKEQTEISLIWAGGAGTPTPPGQWNVIAQEVATSAGTTLSENARLFALLNFATADAAIVAWDCKYEFDLWRPITAIREADSDGNGDTDQDDEWLPLIPTPPFPEYTSGHSTFSSSSAAVLAAFFGTDDMAFTFTAEDAPGIERHFTSFSDAALEAGMSRIYGGIHFQFGNQAGLTSGTALGQYVAGNFLLPIPSPGVAALFGLGALVGVGRRDRAKV